MAQATLLNSKELLEQAAPGDLLSHFFCNYCHPDGDKSFCGCKLEETVELIDQDLVDCVVCVIMDECPECDGLDNEYVDFSANH